MDDHTKKQLISALKHHAQAIGLSAGAAESFITIALERSEARLADKTTITQTDLTRVVASELRKFNADLAYVYQNYDKII